jgi:hypothetical protein
LEAVEAMERAVPEIILSEEMMDCEREKESAKFQSLMGKMFRHWWYRAALNHYQTTDCTHISFSDVR